MRNALVIALFGAALCGAILPAPAGAQVAPGVAAEAQPSPTASAAVVRTIRGIIYTPLGASDVRPAGNTWVTLHRVATDTAGAIDSVRTDPEGHYVLRYRRAASDSAVFFISARYAGITYFSSPMPDADVGGEEAQLVVYDTTSGPLPLAVRGRHVIVGSIDSTRRRPVVEIFEIANDTTITLVADGARPTWQTRIPAQAQDLRLTAGDLSPDAITVKDGVLSVFSPIAPGIKQLGFAYALPLGAFPLVLPVGEDVTLLEVLVEDPLATVTGPGMEAADSVMAEGRAFRRFIGQDVPASGVVRISVPGPGPDRSGAYNTAIVVALGAVMLLALGRSVRRRRLSPLPVPGITGVPDPDDIAARIAALDVRFQNRRNPSEAERLEYERTRGGLKAMLTDALGQQEPRP